MRHLASVALATVCACSVVRGPPQQRESRNEGHTTTLSSFDSLAADAQRWYGDGEYDAARRAWQDALTLARRQKDAAREARVLTDLGLTTWHLGDYTEARRLGEAAVTIELQNKLNSLLPRSYNALGLLAWDQGRLGEAVRLFDQTIAAARAAGDSAYVYRPSANLGLVYSQYGEFDTARRYLLTALAGARAQEDSRTEGRALTNLAVIGLRVGDVPAALTLLSQARTAAQLAGDASNEETILAQQADAYGQLGEPARAFATLDSALRRARRQGATQALAADLELQAGLYREAGDLRRALEIYQRARAIDDDLGLREESGRDLRNEAEIHLRLGNPDLAQRSASRAIEVHRENGAKPAELADLFLLAELAESRNQPGTADGYLGAARALVNSMNVRSIRVEATLAEARVLDRRQDNVGVLRVLDRVAPDLADLGYALEWEAHALRARAYARAGRLDEAVAAGRRALAAAERVRGNLGSEMLQTTYVADRRSAYADLVAVLVSLGRIREAFQVADVARGGTLQEPARAALPLDHPAASPEREGMLHRIAQLASSLSAAERRGDTAAAGELASKLRATRRDFESALVERAEGQGPRGNPAGGLQDLPQIQAALRPDEVLIEYLMADDRLFTFVVTPKDLRAFQTNATASELASRVRLARDLLADPSTNPGEADAALNSLHALLLGNARHAGALNGIRQLTLVPQAGLSYLPFAALRDAGTGRYLIEDFALLYLPTAAALPALRSRITTDVPVPAAVFAPLTRQLPASRIEARRVSRTVGKASTFYGARATEARLRATLAAGGIVHVASHAVLNTQSPLFSRIALAAPSLPTPQNDGQLEIHEVLGLPIRSPLVFLSGCETDLGAAWSTAFTKGEDYATLARAFLYAGARNVIATLWPVQDEGAAAFAARFYQRLLEGAPPAEALAGGQRDLLRGNDYRHPYYWAAYRIAGDGELPASVQNLPVTSVQQ